MANDQFEYAHPGRPRPVSISGVPPRSRLDRLPVIGTAGITDQGDVGLIIPRPSLNLKSWELPRHLYSCTPALKIELAKTERICSIEPVSK